MSEPEVPTAAAPRAAERLGVLDRIPVRSIVLDRPLRRARSFVIIAVYKTLTLPAGRPDWEFWKALLVAGIALGAVYALIALGYSLVYGILRMINFAHGEVFMSGAFVSFFVGRALGANGYMAANPCSRSRSCSWWARRPRRRRGAAGTRRLSAAAERAAARALDHRDRRIAVPAELSPGVLRLTDPGLPRTTGARGHVEVLGGSSGFLGFDIAKVQLLTIAIGIVSVMVLSLFVARAGPVGRCAPSPRIARSPS